MFNAVQFLKDHSIHYWTEGKNVSPGWTNIRCPLCNDHSNHGGFSPSDDYYSCWKCGGHDLSYVISKLLQVQKKQAEEVILEYSTRGKLLRHLNRKQKEDLPTSIEMPGEPLLSIHKKYLKRRNFDPDFISSKYQVMGTGIAGEWKYRLMIPIFFNGKMVSYQGRDVTGKQELRYKTLSPQFSVMNPKHLLYNIDNCFRDTICVVEGIFDVFRMGNNFVATLGTSMTDMQVKLLSKFKTVLFLFDPEPEAQERARKQATKISALGVKTEVVNLELDRDPGDLTEQEARAVRRELLGGMM